MKFIDVFIFCHHICCIYRNRYNGWCHYNNCDISEVKECEYCKKEFLK